MSPKILPTLSSLCTKIAHMSAAMTNNVMSINAIKVEDNDCLVRYEHKKIYDNRE